MPFIEQSTFIRNNPNLKSPFAKEYITRQVFEDRIKQFEKISSDILYFARHYFYILSLDKGKKLIQPYPKQAQVIQNFVKYDRNILLSSRQMGKSTSYSILALWYSLVNSDKNILICANRLKTAVQILSRVKMAYEQLPNWMKPGIIKYSATQVQFSNGCRISAEATSESSGRGQSINLLMLDQFAFIKPNISQAFMRSVFPVVSSSKTAKIIIVSTPNGTANQFYRIYQRALLSDPEDLHAWHADVMNWYDFPGHDQEWKRKQIQSLGGDMTKWQQQYGNCVYPFAMLDIMQDNDSRIHMNIQDLFNSL